MAEAPRKGSGRRRRGPEVAPLARVEDALGYRFHDAALFRRALTHRSYAHEGVGDLQASYERLEFLGDALLGFLVSEWLYEGDPKAGEGVLTRRKQMVVRTSTLASCARRLGLSEALRLSRGEEGSGGRAKPSILADVFEAVLAAVYLDGGMDPARALVRRALADDVARALEVQEVREDYKTRLQEFVQPRWHVTPAYRIVSTEGPAHSRRFEVEVLLRDEVLGRGRGRSRKQAEQAAAAEALQRLTGSEPAGS